MKRKMILSVVSVITLLSASSVSYADLWQGWRTDNATVSVFFTQSVVNDTAFTAIYNSAMANWNGISSKVSLTRTFSSTNAGMFLYLDNSPITNTYWMMRPYRVNSLGQVVQDTTISGVNATWPRTDVILYTSGMATANFTTANRIATATHELWHGLKLAHPGEGTLRNSQIPVWQKSVMVQGIKNYGPQAYDKTDLKDLWWQ